MKITAMMSILITSRISGMTSILDFCVVCPLAAPLRGVTSPSPPSV